MPTTRNTGSLYTRIENGVAIVEFGHPAGNSFVSELLQRLANEFQKLSQNREVSLILLKSEGERAFCAGASLEEMLTIANVEAGRAFFSGFAGVLNAMRICPQPIIGRVQGKVVGGGVGLVAACDEVYATEAASVKLSEISIGIAPLVIAPAVERKIGKGGLAELSLNPTEWKNAYWAQEKGLFSKVFPSLTEMDKALEFHTLTLASCNPNALAALKRVLWEGTEHWDALLPERAAASGRLALSPHTKAALEKFKK